MTEKLTGPALEEALAARGLPSEGNADDKRAAIEQFDAAFPTSSTLDADTTRPSATAPGDGALAAGTVNAVTKVMMPPPPAPRDESDDRIEEYEVPNPQGGYSVVRRNLETGRSVVVGTRPGPKPAN